MLEVSQLTRCYDTFIAVENVSFKIGQGEIVGLLGHNGAGKTTIMKMLSGYLEPNQGEIRINGLNIDNESKAIQSQLGYLPENLPVYPEMRVADYLDYAADLKGIPSTEKAKEIKRVVEATDIKVKLLEPINTLSRGFKQRVGVAQAILGQPKLLILDEPTNGLDPTQTEHMRELIRDIAQHATVILSTHIMQEVEALCDRVLILRAGKLAVDEQLSALRHSNQLLIHTNLDESALKPKLDALPEVSNCQSLPLNDDTPGFHYRLTLAKADENSHASNALVAKAIIEAGGKIYQLHTQHHDLEKLFREVNQHAA